MFFLWTAHSCLKFVWTLCLKNVSNEKIKINQYYLFYCSQSQIIPPILILHIMAQPYLISCVCVCVFFCMWRSKFISSPLPYTKIRSTSTEKKMKCEWVSNKPNHLPQLQHEQTRIFVIFYSFRFHSSEN